ncbi:bleomycin resistance protein [Caulobacter sp. RL271]|jgi:catechol 2,3-dioxygenase-like lactoylglutathione lyase family enzyme|uniref:Bleomycin resistance protein n=1 Tax=Caulobacter segnis TaxID=88688 RepID=A0ABY4ZR64_9CAUL|nr:VOC family protein [Caulobacter segnis]USQ94709.1 VOC family protein [Caulobacter segnis]
MLNLENLRKQAKLHLRWHRERYFPVASQIRSLLPRYRDLSDHEILAAPFKLKDAQDLVARKSGFESWLALKQGLSSMPMANTASASGATLITAEPQLFVSDMARALAFYEEKLGFRRVFVSGDPVFYAQVARDGAKLNLRRVESPVFTEDFRAREPDALSATLTLADAKPLFLEFQNAGVSFHQTLRAEPWGARTFIVGDPDGNLILFAGAD